MSDQQLRVVNPFTEKEEFSLPLLQPQEIGLVVQRSQEAFSIWRDSTMQERIACCQRFGEAVQKKKEDIARDLTRQMGKPLQQSLNEVSGMLGRMDYMMSTAEETLADEWLPDVPGFKRYIRHEPLGVVLDIAAWNYPLLIAVNVVVPAVLAGNAVIVKHSSRTPLAGQMFQDLFREAGVPLNLVQNVVASHEVTAQLIRHEQVNHVSFTGSVKGGHEVMAAASGRFIDVGLELGGKDPAYVCADADFDYAVANCIDGAFYNAGQSCCGIERIYVDQSIYERFVEAYAAGMQSYVLGDPMAPETNLGPLAS